VEDLLDVSHIRVGNLPLRIDAIDVRTLIGKVHRWYAEQDAFPDHCLALRHSEGDYVVLADEDRLEQVITNIFDNAIKYSPRGGEIDVSLECDSLGVLLTVTDSGIGMTPSDLDSIFRPFGRAPNAVEGNFVGLGIGLFICRNIVERHGGRIWATSAGTGAGTTMQLWLRRESAVESAPESI